MGGFERLGEELWVAEAGVALSAVGIEDSQRRPPAWWAGAIARDDHLRSLADDVAPEPDPRSTGELQANAGRLADGCRQPALRALPRAGPAGGRSGDRRRLEDDERDSGPPGERRHPRQSIAESRSRHAASPSRQVDDEQVHRPTREQRARDRQAFEGFGGRQHDEPFRLDAASHRLDGIERRREVQPGHDQAPRLGLRDEPQGQGRPAARDVAPNREPHPTRHATRTEDRIQLGEAGRMDLVRIARRTLGGFVHRPEIRRFKGHGGERPHGLAGEPGRRRSPARAKGCERRCQVGGWYGHGPSIEQMFE
jgi:hypothetical protein